MQNPQALDTVNEVDKIEIVKDLGYSKFMFLMVCMYIFFLDILINVDHGAIPAALNEISRDLEVSDAKMGGLGSLVFFGLVIGSATAGFIFGRISYKYILFISMIINGTSLWLFTAKADYMYMCIARFITGYSQIFLTIYIPLFIDAYCTIS